MANKKITDYQLIAAITSTVNFFVDDLTQNYRATAAQIKDYILAAGNVATSMLADGAVTAIKLASAAVTDPKTNFTAPTYQKFTSGSGTYTTPAGVKRLKVMAIGGGGGGGGGQTGAGNAVNGIVGGATTFGPNISAGGGQPGAGATSGGIGSPGAGGTPTLGGGLVGMVMYGNAGFTVSDIKSTSYVGGGPGGAGPLGGGGSMPYFGYPPQANSGAGGGGGQIGGVAGYAGSGGGSGAFIEVDIYNPSATYSYAVGQGGNFGSGAISGNNGQAAADGVLLIKEYYQ